MSCIFKSVLRLPALKQAGKFLGHPAPTFTKLKVTRSLWSLSSQDRSLLNHKCSNSCICGLRKVHSVAATEVASGKSLTQGEKELAEFLVEEIGAEKKLQKTKKIPSELDGYQVHLDGSEVSLTKTIGDETIEIFWNINHTVDTDAVEPEIEPAMDKPELGEMKSRPTFEVEIKKGETTLGFTCSTVSPSSHTPGQQDDGYNDLFIIDEVVVYSGDWKDSNYSVSGEVLDGTLYDLFMNLLEDKGINNDFVDKLIDFSTAYEHDSYIRMLEGIRKFLTPSK